MAHVAPQARNVALYDNHDAAEHDDEIHYAFPTLSDEKPRSESMMTSDTVYGASVLAAVPPHTEDNPYGAPVDDPYGAPVDNPYGAPVANASPYGAPVDNSDPHSSPLAGHQASHGLSTFGGDADSTAGYGAPIEEHADYAHDAGQRWSSHGEQDAQHSGHWQQPAHDEADDELDDEDEDNAWAALPPSAPAAAFAVTEEPEDTQTRFAKLAKAGEEAQQAGSYDRAIQSFDSALAIPGVPLPMVARVHCQLARCYEATAEARYCLQHMHAFVDCAERFGDEELLCAALTHLGIVQYKTQDFAAALATHQRTLSLAGILGDVGSQMRAHGNIGNVYAARGHFQEAIIHHREQYNLAERLEERDAAARAALNLESDYASLHKYAEAGNYASEKKKRSIKRITVSSTVGDRRPGRTVCAGWLIKHKGGDLAGPKARKENKRFCTIQNGVFSYSNTAAMTRRASRYLRLGEIQDVQQCEVYEDDRLATNSSRSFRIRVRDRAFYFSASSAAECKEWLDSFVKARADVAHFAGTMRGNTNMAASEMFTSQKPSSMSLLSGGGGSSATSPLPTTTSSPAPLEDAMSQAPDGFNDKNVANPLFGDSSFDNGQRDGEPDYLTPGTRTSSMLGMRKEGGGVEGDRSGDWGAERREESCGRGVK